MEQEPLNNAPHTTEVPPIIVPEAYLENAQQPNLYLEAGFEGYVPSEFKAAPFHYFETHGTQIKKGEPWHDDTGRLREDPTAVKDLPDWQDERGNILRVVGKKVNVDKAEVGKSGDPLYEYGIMQKVAALGLPAPKTIGHLEQGLNHMIITERAEGMRWAEKEQLAREHPELTPDDLQDLLTEAENKMHDLQHQFDAAGIIRTWKIKDMVINIDWDTKSIIGLTPTDWERTKIDEARYAQAFLARRQN